MSRRQIISLLFLLGLLGGRMWGVVAISANAPAYNFQVLPGADRTINAIITGGTLNTVNWSVSATAGGATATFTYPSSTGATTTTGAATAPAASPIIKVVFGAVAGTCTITGGIGAYTVASTATVTVRAQSVDDTSKTATFLFNVCTGTVNVIAAPAYQQAFKSQHRTIQSWVWGAVDQGGTWSFVTQPGGCPGAGCATLTDTTKRDADFNSGTVTGRYLLKYTSSADPTKNSTALVYVSPNSLPSWAGNPPNHAEATECYHDPAFTGTTYEVGSGFTYATIQATPAANTLTAGSMIRVHNTDLTGTNPTVYREYYQLASTNSTATQPIGICGVPDSLGNQPIIDGSGATGQAGTSTGAAAGWGVISVWAGGYSRSTPFGYWQTGSAGPLNVFATGLHIRNGRSSNTYTPPGGGAPVNYVVGASCLNARSGTYLNFSGNDLENCDNGVFTAENTNSAWAPVTQAVTIMGNHIHLSGNVSSSTEHQAYLQSYFLLYQGNIDDNYTVGADGSDIKWRGIGGIIRYNYVGGGTLRSMDLVDVQDANPYVNFESYLQPPGTVNCNDSLYCQGDTAGPNVITSYQEAKQLDLAYGNLILGTRPQYQIHQGRDHDAGMGTRNGRLHFYSNTLDNAQVVFDTGDSNAYNTFLTPAIDAKNNILWNRITTGAAANQTEFGREASIVLSSTTNLMKSGTFGIAVPINGGNFNSGTSNGWEATCNFACPWLLTVPINAHLFNLTGPNYLTTATLPYSLTTFVPPLGSAAISAGTAATGVEAQNPVRWQWDVATNTLTPRMNALTIGGQDEATVTHTYYVATTGNDSNPGTFASPWLTINHADAIVVAGDTVIVENGTYTGDVQLHTNGTAGHQITYKAQNKWGAQVVGTGTGDGSTVWSLTSAYTTIQDFDITGSNANGVVLAISGTTAMYNVALGNYVHDIVVPCTSNSGTAMEDGGGNSYVGVSHNSMIGNFVINIHPVGGAGCLTHRASGLYCQTPYCVVANNIIIDAEYAIQSWHAATNITNFGNVIINNLRSITVGSGDGPAGVKTNDFSATQNNIIYNSSSTAIAETNDGISNTGIHNTYTDNLIYLNNTTISLANGLVATGTVNSNPLFVNNNAGTTGNYCVQAASPARGVGLALAGILIDYYGNARPQAGATDIGACIFTGSPQTTFTGALRFKGALGIQ